MLPELHLSRSLIFFYFYYHFELAQHKQSVLNRNPKIVKEPEFAPNGKYLQWSISLSAKSTNWITTINVGINNILQ